jgi:type II secretory pathway component HofQ
VIHETSRQARAPDIAVSKAAERARPVVSHTESPCRGSPLSSEVPQTSPASDAFRYLNSAESRFLQSCQLEIAPAGDLQGGS